MDMECTTMAIEVKYGDTLKRFDAPINEIGELNLDLAGLKKKISGLFTLSSKGEHVLTHFLEFGSDKGGEELPMLNDDHLKTAALLHHTKSKAAQLERQGKNCENESTTGDSEAKEDENVFKVECKRESPDGTTWLPLVIDVRHKDDFKRFKARVDEKGELDLDYAELRAKICDLFSLPSEAEIDLGCYFVDEGGSYMITNDRDLSEAMQLKKMKFKSAVTGVIIKNLKERLYRGDFWSHIEDVPEKDNTVFDMYYSVKRGLEGEDENSEPHQVKKVKWYEPAPSSNRFKELEKRFLEVREESCKGIDEAALNSEAQRIIDEQEAEVQFHESMSKLKLQMLQILEIIKEAPKTPEEYVQKFELIESTVKGFRENALKASKKRKSY